MNPTDKEIVDWMETARAESHYDIGWSLPYSVRRHLGRWFSGYTLRAAIAAAMQAERQPGYGPSILEKVVPILAAAVQPGSCSSADLNGPASVPAAAGAAPGGVEVADPFDNLTPADKEQGR